MKVESIPENNQTKSLKEDTDRKGKRVYDYIFHKDKIFMVTKSVEYNEKNLQLRLTIHEFSEDLKKVGNEILNEILNKSEDQN